MSHTIIAFPQTELLSNDNDNDVFMFIRSHCARDLCLGSYNFTTFTLNSHKWPFGNIDPPIIRSGLKFRPTTSKLSEYCAEQIYKSNIPPSIKSSLNPADRINITKSSGSPKRSAIPIESANMPQYSNLDLYPELNDFIKSGTMAHYVSYGNEGEKYQLDILDDQAYVVRSGNEIRTVHIDTSYNLQHGICTYVWSFNDNFAVFNASNDVYSVVLVPVKHNN